jgi:hypothetical protein
VALNVGILEALLRLRDELSPALNAARKNVNAMANDGSFTAIGQAAAGALGAVGGLATGIAALGSRGADVADVAASFDLLSQGAGGGEAALNTLRTATDGLITDFDLMKTSNLAFSQGLNLTQSELQLTGEAARVLADRVGGDTRLAYETLTAAMATGRDKQLQSIGLNIDAEAAVQKLANSLGVEKGKLNESQETMAKRNAILAAMKTALDESGRAEVDFGERITQAKVTIQNFTDSLGVAIAQSPVLNAGLKTVGDMLQQAFGTNQSQTIQTLMGYIESFAISLLKAGSVAVEVARFIGNAWFGLNAIFNAFVMTVAQSLGLVVSAMLNAAQAGAQALPDMFGGKAMEEGAKKLQLVKDGLDSFAAASKDAIGKNVDDAAAFGGAMDKVQGAIGTVKTAMEGAAGGAAVLSKGTQDVKTAMDETGMSAQEVAKRAAELEKGFDALEDRMAATRKTAQDVARALEEDLAEKIAELTGLTTQQGIELMQWSNAWDDVTDKTQISNEALQAFIETLQNLQGAGGPETIRQLDEAMGEMGKRAAEQQGPRMGVTKEQIEDEIEATNRWKESMLAVGDATDTVLDLLSSIVQFPAAFAAATDSASAFSRALGGAQVGANLGGQIGAIFGPYGEAIGKAAGAIIGGIAGIFKKPSWIKVGKEAGQVLGTEIGKEMAKTIEQKAKDLKVSVKVAALLTLPEVIADSGKAASTFGKPIMDLMRGIADGTIPATEGMKALNETFAQLVEEASAGSMAASKLMVQMLQLGRATKTTTAEMKAFTQNALAAAAEGVKAMINAGTIATIEDAQAQGYIFAASFWAAAAEQGIVSAAQTFADSWQAFKDQLAAADLDPSVLSAITEPIDAVMSLMASETTKNIVTGLDGATQAVKNLGDAGYMTTGAFNALGQQAASAYDKLVAEGVAPEVALQAIAPALAEVKRQQELYGLTVDATTQQLMDQAAAAGIAFPTDPLQQVVQLLQQIVDTIREINGLPVDVKTNPVNVPNIPGEGGPKPPGFAGGLFAPEMPRDMTIGVHKGEEVSVLTAEETRAKKARGGGAGDIAFTSAPTIQVYGSSVDEIMDRMMEKLERNERGNRERLRLITQGRVA